MKPLIYSLCDYTGNWSRPYLEAGYRVIRVDLKDGNDVRLINCPKEPVAGILAAPVCTKFTLSGNGARAREKRAGTYDALIAEALALGDACYRFVMVCQQTFPDALQFWSIENPAQTTIGRWWGKPRFKFNPCDFGGWIDGGGNSDAYTKQTALWGQFNIPQLRPVPPIHGSKMWKRYGGKSERTKAARSATPLGFAYAFFDANNPAGLSGQQSEAA